MGRSGWYGKFAITAGVLAALIGALWILSCLPEEESQDGAMITDVHMGAVAGAALVNDKGGVALMLQNGEIEILDAPQDMVFSASNRKAFLYRMAHIPVKEELGEAKEWEQYGLDQPKAKLTLFLTDGSRIILYLGDQTPLEDSWYLRREDEEILYLVDSVTARMLGYSLDDFREIDVLPVISPESLEGLTCMRLTRDDEIIEIRGEKRGEEVRFMLVSPIEAVLSWQRVAEKLLAPLGGMEQLQVVGGISVEELKERNKKEQYQLTLELNGEERELFFIPGEEDTFYCGNLANGQVILLKGEEVRSLFNQSVAELMDTTLYPANAADMERVEINAEGLALSLELSGQGELLRGYLGGRELNQAETLELFQTLTMIPPAEALEEDALLLEEPILSLYFRRKTGAEDVVELIPISQRRCGVRLNGVASLTTYRATIEEIIRVISAFDEEYFAED